MSLSRQLLLATLFLANGLWACNRQGQDRPAEQAAPQTPSATAPPPSDAPAAQPAASAAPAATPAAFDVNSVPVTSADLGEFPYLSVLKGYEVKNNDSEELDFDRSYIYDGKTFLPVEGKVSRRFIQPASGQKKASELMIRRNYEDLLKGLGAATVFVGKPARAAYEQLGFDEAYKHGKWSISTDHETGAYVIRQPNKEVWVKVTTLGRDGDYHVEVIERAAMPQQAQVIPAGQLKKQLDAAGRATLYINFDTDQATVKPESMPTLVEVAKLLRDNPDLKLAVQGHTDNAGTPPHNQQLSEARARTAVTVLTAQGVAANRLQAAGFGQTKPLADNATDEGKAKNRRVELVKL